MPFYDYKCDACGHAFEEFLAMSKRKSPCNQGCPACGVKKVRQYLPTSPSACDPVRVGKRRIDGGFREVISKIKKGHPRNNIPDY
jgi:putative FmdB family regulatory protein